MATLSDHTGHGDSGESHTGIEGGSGRLFVISAPSGAGKSTLCRALLAHDPDLNYSISYTSRKPRGQERDGVEYHFISEDEFERGIESGRWDEWARVHGNYYGTSAADLQRQLTGGSDVLLDIDVEGARQIRKRFPESVTIFIMPPSMAALEQRLRERGTESETDIRRRLQNAKDEMHYRGLYRHVIVNDRLPQAMAELIELIDGYRRQASQQR
ncbi:MAG TPA: guanylate kinase [Desulfobacterales bacterium]